MSRRCWWVAGFVGLLAVCGCSSGPRLYEVTGTVTFDDKPVPEGDIYFIPDDPALGAEYGKITDGSYSLRAKAGPSRVKIYAVREVPGKKDPMGTGPATEDYIPAKYNDQTELQAEVGKGSDKFDFSLKSK